MQNFRNKKERLLRRGGANLYKSQIHRATDECMGEEKNNCNRGINASQLTTE